MTKKVIVVFKTHLDIGFTDLASVVYQKYIQEYIPKALTLAEKMNGKFIWTTGSWLIMKYLASDTVSSDDKERMKKAINQGRIAWHGLPVTTHTELMDQKLFEYGLSISKKLDLEFNKKTIAAKMTDVPGHTIGIVPLLAKAGIQYLHIGVNASSAVPDVPKLFIWQAKNGEQVVVNYAGDYGETYQHPDWDEILYFAHSHDNAGPPLDVDEINQLYAKLEKQYPEYEIEAGTLDDFAKVAWSHKAELPVVTEEIGDSWIHGVGSDPLKVSHLRKLLQLRDKWLESGILKLDSSVYRDFSENLMLVAEHTWGMNGNVYFPDYRNYLLSDFLKSRAINKITINSDPKTNDFADRMYQISNGVLDKNRLSFSLYESSWKEQRTYIDQAITCLPAKQQAEAYQCFRVQDAPTMKADKPIITGKRYTFKSWKFALSAEGGFQYLEKNGRQLLTGQHQFGRLSYERFGFMDFSRFSSEYSRLNQQTASWALVDFAKRGIEAYPEIHYEKIYPYTIDGNMEMGEDKLKIELKPAFQDEQIQKWGLPTDMILRYEISNDNITGRLLVKGKQKNRMPEAYWLETDIQVNDPTMWTMNKLGYQVDPGKVVKNGNRKMHAVDVKGLSYIGADGHYQISSVDAPLFGFGNHPLLNFDNQIVNLNDGIQINLYNNVWGTNFPAWFDDNMEYQFNLFTYH